ncbi:hypothetical protein [Nocardia jiangsuensis]|uniref:Uncharacterized protein n=1 Tax=Nocardia jiangsuensis TaxID=1691563 RepID=A0ABV8E1B9_9NOCA
MTGSPGWTAAEPPPGIGPRELDIAARERFDSLLAAAPAGIQTSAEKWSAGLLALLALITASVIVKGPTTVGEVADGWRWLLIALVVSALLAALTALWKLLAVSARRFETMSRTTLFGEPGEFEHRRTKATAKDAASVRWAIRLGALALLLQVAAVTVWALIPPPSKSPPAYLTVETAAGKVCGEVVSGDNGELRLKVTGERDPRVVPWAGVTNIRLTEKC